LRGTKSRTLNSARPSAGDSPVSSPSRVSSRAPQRHTLNFTLSRVSLSKNPPPYFQSFTNSFLSLFLSLQKERAFIFNRYELFYFSCKRASVISSIYKLFFLPKKHLFSFFSSDYELFLQMSFF